MNTSSDVIPELSRLEDELRTLENADLLSSEFNGFSSLDGALKRISLLSLISSL